MADSLFAPLRDKVVRLLLATSATWITLPAMAITIDLDLDEFGDTIDFLDSSRFNRRPIVWQSDGGVGGSGGYVPTSLHATTYGAASFDFTSDDAEVQLSTFFKTGTLEPVGVGSFETFGEVYLTDAPNGFPSENDTAFVEIRRDSSNDGFSAGPLQAGGGSFPGFSVDYPVGTLLSDRWYQIDVTYTNEGPGRLGWDIKVNDYGSDGLTFVETIMSDTRVTDERIGFTTEPDLYAGFSAVGFGRVAGVDNFFVTDGIDPNGPQTVSLTPSFDVQYRPGAVSSLIEGETSLNVGGFPGFEDFPEQRPVMEFPLASIPTDATIVSARLQLDTFVSSGEPRVEVIGYEGDGLASLSDGTVAGEELAVSPPTTASTGFDVELDTGLLQQLLGDASHLGVRLRSLDVPEYVGFDSLENAFGEAPTLVVEYAPLQIPGDFNGDGAVNLLDLDILGRNFGRMGDATFADGDANGDGNVDLLDLDILGLNFDAPASEAVPEPAAGLLALLACGATGVCRSRLI